MRTGPDFFIVGAPKSGTTALDQYLREHPAIFMTIKEQHYFGSDLVSTHFRRPTADAYFGGFPPYVEARRCGDASVWYLSSTRAAEEIYAYDPRARIIVMLRNPVDMVHSLHSYAVYLGFETIADFGEALASDGGPVPGLERFTDYVQHTGDHFSYRNAGRYSEQLRRYLEVFGRDQVHVILFEDFKQNPLKEYQQVLRFLGVDPSFAPDVRVVNPNRRARSERLRTMERRILQPPRPVRQVVRAVIPMPRARARVRQRLKTGIEEFNTVVTTRPAMDPEIRATLTREYTPEVLSLAELIGRNLDHWLAPETRARDHLPHSVSG